MKKKQKKTVLVTGVCGFIGSHLAQALIKLGYFVIGIDKVSMNKKRLSDIKDDEKFIFYKINILNTSKLSTIFLNHKIDTIVHLAAKAGVRPSLDNPKDYFNTNVLGTINILEQAQLHKIKHLIFASSSSVYGNNKKVPFLETDTTQDIVSPYGASKKSAEIICKTYADLYKMNITIFRFFSVFGPGGRRDMAPFIFAKAILHNETIQKFGNSIKRDYTYIDDIISGIIKGIEKPFRFEIINLGNHSPIHLEELITKLEKMLDKKADVQSQNQAQGDVNVTYASIQKAKEFLDWEPMISIDEGLQLFANWMKAHLK